jgi:hypothetical protein
MALAAYALVYTMAAASIGGIPGGAAITVSIERVKSAPMAAAVLTVISLVLLFYVGPLISAWIVGVTGIESLLIARIVDAVVKAILGGYVAIVMAKVYSDVSFTMPRW